MQRTTRSVRLGHAILERGRAAFDEPKRGITDIESLAKRKAQGALM